MLLMMMVVVLGSVAHSPFLYGSFTPSTWFSNSSFTVIEDRAYFVSSPSLTPLAPLAPPGTLGDSVSCKPSSGLMLRLMQGRSEI